MFVEAMTSPLLFFGEYKTNDVAPAVDNFGVLH
jgi:hypothetical protein